jgi:hypothetical protein
VTAYQIFSVGPDGHAVALRTADTALGALAALQDALSEHPRAWVVDEHDFDVSIAELRRRADDEQKNA